MHTEAPTPVTSATDVDSGPYPRMMHRTHQCGVEPKTTWCGLPHGRPATTSEAAATIWCAVCEDLRETSKCKRCGKLNQ
jgi:hypothetical protein